MFRVRDRSLSEVAEGDILMFLPQDILDRDVGPDQFSVIILPGVFPNLRHGQ